MGLCPSLAPPLRKASILFLPTWEKRTKENGSGTFGLPYRSMHHSAKCTCRRRSFIFALAFFAHCFLGEARSRADNTGPDVVGGCSDPLDASDTDVVQSRRYASRPACVSFCADWTRRRRRSFIVLARRCSTLAHWLFEASSDWVIQLGHGPSCQVWRLSHPTPLLPEETRLFLVMSCGSTGAYVGRK